MDSWKTLAREIVLDRGKFLRVEDHATPIAELTRLYKLRKAYDLATQGDDYFAAKEFEKAFQAYDAALTIVPENDELIFWRGAMLMQAGIPSYSLRTSRPWASVTVVSTATMLVPDLKVACWAEATSAARTTNDRARDGRMSAIRGA